MAGSPDGPGRIILAIAERGEEIWVGTNGGLLRLDTTNGEVSEFQHEPGRRDSLGPGYVKAILSDRGEQLWVGTGEGGVQRFDPDGRVRVRFVHDPRDPTSLSDHYVTSLLETRDGAMWVGTRSGGLNRLDPETGRAERYLPDPAATRAISHHYVTSLYEDRSGRLWVTTSGGGVNRVDRSVGAPPHFTWFTEKDGLADNDVMAILEDDDGSLWLSTKSGLSRFDPDRETFSSIFVSDGLPTGEFESGAAARGSDALWFGTVKGLVTFPTGSPFPPPNPSPMVVTSIRSIDGEIRGARPAWKLDSLELPWNEWLSIELAVLDYSPEIRHRYAYRLDEDWVDIGSRREITFTDLKPGVHEFTAMGRNSQGVWSAETPLMRVKVVPPFWMTGRFRVAVAFVVLGLAVLGHRLRVNNVEKRNRKLLALHEQREKTRNELARAYQRLRRLTRRLEAAKEEERRHIARELHDEMGPAMTAVIINLQLLAERGTRDDARERIRDTIALVDRLVDRIRDLSLDLRPPLLDELGLVPALKGYMETQAERTGIDIEVLGEVAPGDLQPEVEITAFRVVQEAVTNVIRHAQAGRTTITVRQKNGDLELNVKDDGRGFNVQSTMGGAPGKALGLLGMQERVGMMGGEVRIDSGAGRGTEVRVRMPVEMQP
jgi:signal transduction histidine kinase/streptogramin lyase